MPVQESVDMSAAWLAHAPPPPPPTTDVRKPRRSSSYEPMSAKSAGQMNDTHMRGGYLPPSSHSPEPPRQRRTSVEELKTAAASSSTPSSPVKRARSKVASNPVPPAPSAFYNYQHQLQQQQQMHRQREQSAPTPSQPSHPPAHEFAYSQPQTHPQPPPQSVAMTYSHSDAASAPVHPGYARERRDSAPASTFANTQPPYNVAYSPQNPQHPQHASAVSPVYTSSYATTSGPPVAVQAYAAPAPGGYAPRSMVPASHLQHLASHAPQYSVPAHQHQHWLPPQPAQPATQPGVPHHYYTAAPVPPASGHPWDAHAVNATPPQQAGMAFPTTTNAMPPITSPEMHTFPATQMSPTPGGAPNGAQVPPPVVSHAAYASDLSRQSTTSSVGSVRRPLPQPTRTSSNPSAPGSPSTGTVGLNNRASVRRDLPRLPPGSPATISAASTFASSNLAKRDNSSPGSPDAATMSRLPPAALNRTESVRLAAEALMARGAPQRRPLRSALASTTFSPPLLPTRMAASPLAQSSPLPSSQSEPATAGTGASAARTAAQYTAEVTAPSNPRGEPQSSQSDGSILASSVGSRTSPSSAQPANGYSHHAQHGATSAPARYQDAMNQAAQYNQPQAPAQNHAAQRQSTDELAASINKMSVSQPATSPAPAKVEQPAVSIPVFSFDAPEAEPERPRRRRGSSVSRASPSPGHKVIQHTTAPSAVPTIVLPGDDDAFDGPSIQVSGPDGDNGGTGSAPMISISTDDDDARSQTSNGSRGPAISVSFSGEPAAKSQRAGTSHSPSSTPYGKKDVDSGRVSASSVGSGAGCHGCRKWIAGKVVHALGTTFHPSCFVCAHCSEGLEHVAFYEHEGLPYCHFDYHELFSKRCFHCRTPIVDERYITVQDDELTGQDGETNERCYHELHFFCANCGDPFLDPKVAGSAAGSDPGQLAADENGKIKHGGMEFIVHKGYPYCEKCHVSLHKPRCKACKKPIVDDLISALGGKYHPECFTCTACAQPFSDTQFFVKDAKPYDEECYKVLLRNMI
ncbi:hypothetical protein L1887_54397 [Cichorium endivia]|nr:hypothetical protein L1887_54397 [Cichorium endivia]